MDTNLIRRLNELNRQFYQQVAPSFSSSRSYYWQGWNKLVPYLEELVQTKDETLNIVDIGCGNGRLAAFIVDQLPELDFAYFGLDNSRKLLQIAQRHELMNYIEAQFIEVDLVESLLEGNFVPKIEVFKPDFITALGILHHIPSHQLRQQFLIQLGEVLNPSGFLVFTTWNFLENKRFKRKIKDPDLFDLNPDELEEHDVILDWQRGETAYRYCHYTDGEELNKLIEATELTQVSQFRADGKTGRLNTYTVLQKEKT